MRGFFPLFENVFPNHFRAKEFCCSILRVVKARNARSHQDYLQFTVSDVVDGIHQMMRILESIGKVEEPAKLAAARMKSLLEEAQRLLEMCPDDSGERNDWTYDAVALQRLIPWCCRKRPTTHNNCIWP